MIKPVRHSLVSVKVLLIGLLLPFTVWSAERMYSFTDIENRSFDGMVMDFNPSEQLVTIRRADGKTGKIALTRFSEPDRRYICNWGITNDFMNGVGITVRLASGGAVEAAGGASEQVVDFHYRVQIRNESPSTFAKVAVEYCIFYRQGVRDGNTVRYDEGVCYGKANVEPLGAASSEILETKRVRLYSQSGLNSLFGVSDNLSDAEIRGIWLRIRTKSPLGAEIVREYRTSYDELWNWTPYSIAAGRNEGHRGGYQYFLK